MRIAGGRSKGQRIAGPRQGAVRPTSEKVREAVYSIIGPNLIQGANVLDLFAGTGAMGLEALSRGARHAVFVESDHRVLSNLRQNVERLGCAGDSRIIGRPVMGALAELEREEARFEVVFLDPPYGQGLVWQVLGSGRVAPLLVQTGLVVAEHRRGEGEEDTSAVGGLFLLDRRRYGDTEISILGL